ncbi:thioredoxin domain-containing protein [Brevibacillus sp. WF146]|jgi:thioredoxin 1|uniref:thioredoxin family protein n=1 Tax=Brevibacillus sp. WF146 TaxID=319501 RepID=UPI0007ECD77D|nr:thioredoxin domain-containing protein [Brevibacillus sp. WF146]UYZ12605.1 thioredoxin domain-containing protein [Brevibacillus sp. WF146]
MIDVNKENFSHEVLQSDKPVLVDVWGPNCQPCLALMPEVEKLSEQYQGKVKVVKMNSAENRRLCIDLKVIGLPSFLLYKDGQVVARLSGKDIHIEEIKSFVDNHL